MMWQTVAVELGVCAWVIVLLVRDIFTKATSVAKPWKLALAGLVALAAILWWQQPYIGSPSDPMFTLDRFAWTFKAFFLITTAVVVLMTRAYTRHLAANVGEFYLLVFCALLGMLTLASVRDLLLLFVGLELLTFSLYVMVAYLKQEAASIEAGMKYLVIGSVSSGLLVYGISLLYGASGTTSFAGLRQAFAGGPLPPMATAGLLLVMAGLGFKVAAVPFHLWVPDVYEGAPTPVAALLSVGSKMAGVVALLRLLYGAFLPAQAIWSPVLAVLAAATILYGNLAALPQTNIKRLLGYSSIGHAGYLLMGLSTATASGASAIGFYLLAYMVSNLAVFFVVVVASEALESDHLDAYNGLARRSPMLAATMFVGLLSLAGVPPLAGFVGKLLVLLATVRTGRLWLALIGAANVAVSLYYYLMVVKRMYAGTPSSNTPIAVDGLTKATLFALLIAILAIGVFSQPSLELASSAAASLLQ